MKSNRKGENTLVFDVIVEYIKTSPQPITVTPMFIDYALLLFFTLYNLSG